MYLGQLRKMIGKLSDVEGYTADIEHAMLEEAERIERMLERRGEHISDQDQKINALTNRIKEIQQDFEKLSDSKIEQGARLDDANNELKASLEELKELNKLLVQSEVNNADLQEQVKDLKQDQYSESW